MPPRNDDGSVWQYIVRHGNDPDVCWEWRGSWGGRRGQIRPYIQIGGKKRIAYRVVYEQFFGESIPVGAVVRHRCDNGTQPIGCCNPMHLELGTHTENMDDMKTRERHGLPHEVVRKIRGKIAMGWTQYRIACWVNEKYPELGTVDRRTISAIKTGVVYAHVR